MGMQFRRRTKGKNTWLNFSGSGASISHKTGRVTANIGPRGLRATVNLGNGFRYVKTRGSRGTNDGFFVGLIKAFFLAAGFLFVAGWFLK